tara:strand:- start:5164 stop:5370 length:207 start_codon:yes stop_codon:yes gene_type:complete
MKYWGGWSFIEAYNLPVGLRKWFVERLAKQLEKEKEEAENIKSSSGKKNNRPAQAMPPGTKPPSTPSV